MMPVTDHFPSFVNSGLNILIFYGLYVGVVLVLLRSFIVLPQGTSILRAPEIVST